MNEDRRQLLAAGSAATTAMLLAGAADAKPAAFDPIPARPRDPPPGRAGDFDFLTGEWRIHNRSIVDGAWLAYEGEASVVGLLKGAASVEELRIPARGFSGLGVRLLDVGKGVWVDHWVNARSGALSLPGQTGGFIDGVGVFFSDYQDQGRAMTSAGVWDLITPVSCRWRQASSADGGRTWEHNWIMDWRRV